MRSSKRPPRLPWIVPLVAAAVLLVAVLVGALLLCRWIRSEECHALLESKASEALGGDAEVGPLEWLWVGVASSRVHATGSGVNPVRSFEAGNVRAKLRPSTLLRGFWGVEEISIGKTKLHFAPPSSPGSIAPGNLPTPPPRTALPTWIPTLMVIEAVRSGDTDLQLELPEGKSLQLSGSKVAFFPEPHGARIEASGGELLLSRFPDFPLRLLSAHGRIDHGLFRLNAADLSFGTGGAARLEGLFPDESGLFRVEAHWRGVPVGGVVPSAKDYVSGTLSGSSRASWRPEGPNDLEGSVSADDAEVHDLPTLGELARFTGMEEFRHLRFQKASASFSRRGTITSWHDIVLESKNLLKFTGSAEVDENGSLSGDFQAGITADIVRVIPMARELLSAEEHEGFLWIPVHVEGSLSHPTEDLHPRLLDAIAAKASGVIRGALGEGLRMLGVQPGSSTNPPQPPSSPGNAIKSLGQDAGSVIDAVGGFLK
jgi:hypothetical protein